LAWLGRKRSCPLCRAEVRIKDLRAVVIVEDDGAGESVGVLRPSIENVQQTAVMGDAMRIEQTPGNAAADPSPVTTTGIALFPTTEDGVEEDGRGRQIVEPSVSGRNLSPPLPDTIGLRRGRMREAGRLWVPESEAHWSENVFEVYRGLERDC